MKVERLEEQRLYEVERAEKNYEVVTVLDPGAEKAIVPLSRLLDPPEEALRRDKALRGMDRVSLEPSLDSRRRPILKALY